MFLDRVIHFGETFGNQVKVHSPKKLKTLTDVPILGNMKLHVLIINMILISSPLRVLTPSHPFLVKFGLLGKGWYSQTTKNFIPVCPLIRSVFSLNKILLSSP